MSTGVEVGDDLVQSRRDVHYEESIQNKLAKTYLFYSDISTDFSSPHFFRPIIGSKEAK